MESHVISKVITTHTERNKNVTEFHKRQPCCNAGGKLLGIINVWTKFCANMSIRCRHIILLVVLNKKLGDHQSTCVQNVIEIL